MKRFGKAVLITLLADIVAGMALSALTNVIEGKDIFGNKIDRKLTQTDYLGRIHLGREDYEVI